MMLQFRMLFFLIVHIVQLCVERFHFCYLFLLFFHICLKCPQLLMHTLSVRILNHPYLSQHKMVDLLSSQLANIRSISNSVLFSRQTSFFILLF